MKKVAILMATYNGEKYVGAQIGSILNQDYPNFELYIRDDASKDDTVKVIESYSNPRLHLIKGQYNLGYPGGFYALFKEKIEADYYAFADQDDVWMSDKISKAIKRLEKVEAGVPAAYYAGYHICDGDLNILRESAPINQEITFKDTLFEVPGLEFTMVFNAEAYRLWQANMPNKCKGRGTWACMLIAAFGKIIIDNDRVAYYRRHEQSVTSQNIGSFKEWKERIHTFFHGGFDSYKILLKDFNEVVGSKLPNDKAKLLARFAEGNRFGKMFYPARLRRQHSADFMLRIVFLLGLI